ncbi:MAG: hypothetical protein ACRDF1_07895, partial [bacterium]
VLLLVAACTSSADRQRLADLDKQVAVLQNKVRALSYNTASGGGINVKMMPDPITGQPTVPMEEQFSFDRNHAICRVATNPRAFKMPTYQMGEVIIQPHKFFMEMETTTVDKYEVTTVANGKRKVTMQGGLSCATEVGQTTTTLGSRTAKEHATYLIEAIDAGRGGGQAGDSFAFTVFFDPKESPLNYKIFGPKFTFTGKMTEGEITVIDPSK